MSDVFSIISIICFVFAGAFFVAAVALFFALDVRGVYAEINGKIPVKKTRAKNKKVAKETPTEISREVPTIIEDEAVTVLDSGEIDVDSLVGFYEPGTDIAAETATELDAEIPTELDDEQPIVTDVSIDDEQPTSADVSFDDEQPTTTDTGFDDESPTMTDAFFDDEQPTSAEEAITDFDSSQGKFEIQRDIMLTDRSKALYQLINQ